jgi:hypothetical protein
MAENSKSRTSFSTEKEKIRSFRGLAMDGYQPQRALTSAPPRGRSGVQATKQEKPEKKAPAV